MKESGPLRGCAPAGPPGSANDLNIIMADFLENIDLYGLKRVQFTKVKLTSEIYLPILG